MPFINVVVVVLLNEKEKNIVDAFTIGENIEELGIFEILRKMTILFLSLLASESMHFR